MSERCFNSSAPAKCSKLSPGGTPYDRKKTLTDHQHHSGGAGSPSAVALVGVRLAGIRTFTVLSGSMEPTYHVGSLIYVKKVDPTTIRPGQVITFMLDENTVATHRVVEVVPDEDDPSTLRFRTKGDANDAEDGSLVHYKNVIGTPVFTIPKLGYVANYIQHPPGLYVAISAGAVLLLLTFLPDLLSGGSDKGQGKHIRQDSQKA